jgi:hypothetical protein
MWHWRLLTGIVLQPCAGAELLDPIESIQRQEVSYGRSAEGRWQVETEKGRGQEIRGSESRSKEIQRQEVNRKKGRPPKKRTQIARNGAEAGGTRRSAEALGQTCFVGTQEGSSPTGEEDNRKAGCHARQKARREKDWRRPARNSRRRSIQPTPSATSTVAHDGAGSGSAYRR